MKGDSLRADGLVTLSRAGLVHLVVPARPGWLRTRCGLDRLYPQVRAAVRPVTCPVCARWDRPGVVAPPSRQGPVPAAPLPEPPAELPAGTRVVRLGAGQAAHLARDIDTGGLTRCGRKFPAGQDRPAGPVVTCRLCRRWARVRAVGPSRWADTRPRLAAPAPATLESRRSEGPP